MQSRLELVIDSRTGEKNLKRLDGQLDRVDRRGQSTANTMHLLRRAMGPLSVAISGLFTVNALRSQVAFGDELQKIGMRLGASTEALSQYNYIASQSGVQFGQLTTAWQRQTRRIAEAAQGTGAAAGALDRLNLSAEELSRLAPEEQFEVLSRALRGVSVQSERVALAMKLWDTEGVNLLQIVDQGADAIDRMKQEAEALGLTISQQTADDMASFNDEVDKLSFAFQGVSQAMLSELIPAMTDGLQSVSAFIDDIGGASVIVDRLTDALKIGGAVMAGRFAGGVATAAAAQLAATQQTIAYQAALARMAGVSTTAAAAQTALAGATGTLRAAMMALGGPIGILIGVGGLLYVFRDELGLVQKKAGLTEEQIDALKKEMSELSNAQIGSSLSQLGAEMDAMTLKAATAREELAALRNESRGSGVLGFAAGEVGKEIRGMQAVANAQARIAEIDDEMAVAKGEAAKRIVKHAEAFVTYADRLDDANDETEEAAKLTKTLSDVTSEAAGAVDEQAKAYTTLLDRLYPLRTAQREYIRDQELLNQAHKDGIIDAWGLYDAYGRLADQQDSGSEGAAEWGIVATDSLDGAKSAADDLGFAFESAFESAVIGGNRSRDVLAGIAEDIAKIAIREAVTKPLGGAISQGIGGMLGGMFGGGGYAGGDFTSHIGQAHDGLDRVPKTGTYLLEKGERVTTAETSAKLDRTLSRIGSGGGGATVQIIDQRSGGERAQVQESRGADGMKRIRVLIRDEVKGALSDGSMDSTMARNFGQKRRPI